jgi:2-amino-4-hydroxy-6-hydroxymethyldihydropteridine diphosphokinase
VSRPPGSGDGPRESGGAHDGGTRDGGGAPVAALVALGSNLPPRRATLAAAVEALAALPHTRLAAVSSLRETAPVDCPPGSGPFLNGAVLLHTALSPRALLAELQRIEAAHGRRRGVRHAPRRLDLDLIVHGEEVSDEPGLVLPHPRAHERDFVLEPAAELLPEGRHPRLGRTWRELRDGRAQRAGA